MDRASVGARVNAGLAKAARRLGAAYDVYRPATAMEPLAQRLLTVQAAIATEPGLKMRTPAGYGAATRYLLGDSGALLVGDVLVGDSETLFVAAREDGVPALLVACNSAVRLFKMAARPAYGGAGDVGVTGDWPCSLLLSGRADAPAAGLPDDVRGGSYDLLLPSIPGVTVVSGMRATSAQGVRLRLAGVEQSERGYRIQAVQIGI